MSRASRDCAGSLVHYSTQSINETPARRARPGRAGWVGVLLKYTADWLQPSRTWPTECTHPPYPTTPSYTSRPAALLGDTCCHCTLSSYKIPPPPTAPAEEWQRAAAGKGYFRLWLDSLLARHSPAEALQARKEPLQLFNISNVSTSAAALAPRRATLRQATPSHCHSLWARQ